MAHTGLQERIQILLIFRVENFKWKFTPYHHNLDKENLCRSGFYFPLIFYFIRRCFPLVIKDIWHISHVPTKLKLKIRIQSIPSGTHRQKYSTHSLSLIKPSCNYNITNGGISMARWLFIFGICIAFDHELFRRAFLLINLSLLKSEWLKGNSWWQAPVNCGGKNELVAWVRLLTFHPDDAFVISINWLSISCSKARDVFLSTCQNVRVEFA